MIEHQEAPETPPKMDMLKTEIVDMMADLKFFIFVRHWVIIKYFSEKKSSINLGHMQQRPTTCTCICKEEGGHCQVLSWGKEVPSENTSPSNARPVGAPITNTNGVTRKTKSHHAPMNMAE